MTPIPKDPAWRVRLAEHWRRRRHGVWRQGIDSVGPDDRSESGRLSTYRRLLDTVHFSLAKGAAPVYTQLPSRRGSWTEWSCHCGLRLSDTRR
jgi:hypothetical protein